MHLQTSYGNIDEKSRLTISHGARTSTASTARIYFEIVNITVVFDSQFYARRRSTVLVLVLVETIQPHI